MSLHVLLFPALGGSLCELGHYLADTRASKVKWNSLRQTETLQLLWVMDELSLRLPTTFQHRAEGVNSKLAKHLRCSKQETFRKYSRGRKW